MAIEDFDARVMTFLNGFTNNPSSKHYLTDFVARNAISINTLIVCDMFGSRSDFDSDNPAPSIMNQIGILKAHLLNEQMYGGYVIDVIAQPLIGFSASAEGRSRNLDNQLLNLQWRRQLSWIETHIGNPTHTVQEIDKLQILNKMALMLDSIEEESTQKTEMNAWIAQHATHLFTAALPANNWANRVTILGAPQFSQFARDRIQNFIKVYNATRENIISISQEPFSLKAIIASLAGAIVVSAFLGKCALLPVGIMLTASQEAAYYLEQLSLQFLDHILPESNQSLGVISSIKRAIKWALPLMAYFAALLVGFQLASSAGFTITPAFAMGYQLFPASWSWEFIANSFLLIAATEFALGTALFCGQQVRRLWSGQSSPQVDPVLPAVAVDAAPPANEVDLALDAIEQLEINEALAASTGPDATNARAGVANTTPQVVNNTPTVERAGPGLEPDQRRRLQILLTSELRSPAENEIREELKVLRNPAVTYQLSQRAQALIQRKDPIPAEFASFAFPWSSPSPK